MSAICELYYISIFITPLLFVCELFCFSAVSNHAYYMIGNLAVFEQKIMHSISDYLRTKGLEELAGPDIVKAVIAVG